MLAGGAAAKVDAGEEDAGTVEALLVKRVVSPLPGGGVKADIVESKLAEAVKGDALHEACGDDTVGVDVCARDVDGGSGDGGYICKSHAEKKSEGRTQAAAVAGSKSKTSRASAMDPVTAAAATITGDMRTVRPVGEP